MFSHLPYPARAVGSFKEVIVILVFQLLQVNVTLREVKLPSDLSVGSIGNVAKEIIDHVHEIRLAFAGEFPGGDL